MAESNTQFKQIRAFRGINKALEPYLLEDGYLADAKNMVADNGSIRTRKGWTVRDRLSPNRLLSGNNMFTALMQFDSPTGDVKHQAIMEPVDPNEPYNPDYSDSEGTGDLDSDGDGMPDWWEEEHGLDPNDPSDADNDPDGDGLTNLEEYKNGTDPHNADTDGDGVDDGTEVDNGDNPNDSTDNGSDDSLPDDTGDDDGSSDVDVDDGYTDDPNEVTEDPSYTEDFILASSLPEKIYWRCQYMVEVEAQGGSGTFDGTGATLRGVIGRENNSGVIVDQGSTDISSGWDSNYWAETYVPTSDLNGYKPNLFAVRADINDETGFVATAAFSVPSFKPKLPNGASTGSSFTLRVECQDDNGQPIQSYDDTGADLTLQFQYFNTQRGQWEDFSTIQDTGTSSFPDLQSNWATGVWERTIEFTSVPDNIGGFRVLVDLFDWQWQTSDNLGSQWRANFSVDNLTTGSPPYLRLSKLTTDGKLDKDAAPDNLSLMWEKYSQDSGSWESVDNPPVYMDTGNKLDPNEGWREGTWDAPLHVPDYAEEYNELRVTVKQDGSQVATATGELGAITALKAAINEREKAVGVTGLDPESNYTLTELRSYVNDIAPWFIADNSYSGGSAKPNMLSDQYADWASDESELYNLVLDMKITRSANGYGPWETSNVVGGHGYASNNYLSGGGYSMSTMFSNAQSDYNTSTYDSSFYSADDYELHHEVEFDDDYCDYDEDYDKDDQGWQSCSIDTEQRTYYCTGLPTDIQHRGHLYVMAEILYWDGDYEEEYDLRFDPQGLNVAENTYTAAVSGSWNTNSHENKTFGLNTPCPNSPAYIQSVTHHDLYDGNGDYDCNSEYSHCGFRIQGGNAFLLVEWDFQHK